LQGNPNWTIKNARIGNLTSCIHLDKIHSG